MKILRVGAPGAERPAVLAEDGTVRDLSGLTDDIDGAFLAGGGLGRARAVLAAGHLPPVSDPTGLRVGAPIARPGKIVCVGLNYADHAAESGAAPPPEPVAFLKAANTMVGPHDDVLIPRGSVKTDYEIELAVVVGAVARYLDSPADADAVIAGYTIGNDVSEREYQLERGGGQWDKGKSCETFTPLGPWLVTADEVGDPQDLALRLWVNGALAQDGHTRNMIFDVRHIVWHLSQFMVLEPGDVVSTGTPAGVAMGRPGQPFLRGGDLLELEIQKLGRQRQRLANA